MRTVGPFCFWVEGRMVQGPGLGNLGLRVSGNCF